MIPTYGGIVYALLGTQFQKVAQGNLVIQFQHRILERRVLFFFFSEQLCKPTSNPIRRQNQDCCCLVCMGGTNEADSFPTLSDRGLRPNYCAKSGLTQDEHCIEESPPAGTRDALIRKCCSSVTISIFWKAVEKCVKGHARSSQMIFMLLAPTPTEQGISKMYTHPPRTLHSGHEARYYLLS